MQDTELMQLPGWVGLLSPREIALIGLGAMFERGRLQPEANNWLPYGSIEELWNEGDSYLTDYAIENIGRVKQSIIDIQAESPDTDLSNDNDHPRATLLRKLYNAYFGGLSPDVQYQTFEDGVICIKTLNFEIYITHLKGDFRVEIR